MSNQLNYNMGKLARFILRRDRIRIPVWIITITVITIIMAPALIELFPTEQDRIMIAETMRNPAMTAMVGPGYGLDNYTAGAMMAHQMLLFTALAVAIMSIFIVSRHTRADEEGGRTEVIRSLPVGRLSSLTATTIVAFGTNILLALIVGLGLYALGIDSMDLNGSLLYGASLGATGIVFTAITALFAQLSENSRGTTGYSFAVLGLAYLLRAIGDVGNESLSLISPLGLILRTEVYINNYWWPILVTIAVSIAITSLAYYLNSIRDLGAGFISSRPGRKTASSMLKGPVGLSLKLQRTGIISWAVGMFILGASYGSVAGDMETFFQSNEMYQQMLPSGASSGGYSLTEQYVAMLMSVISMISTIPALTVILKLRSEEKRNRVEHLLARAVSRTRLIGSSLIISTITCFVMLFLSIIGLWSVGTAVMDDPISLSLIFNAGMAYLPAMWVMIGVAVLLTGCFPQRTGFSWLYLGYSFFVVYLGQLLQFPDWMAKISPFGHIPKLPVEDMDFAKVIIIAAIALLLSVLGLVGYNKRDIQG